MRLTSRKVSRDAPLELSMTSMIDVVFLLLTFFMTASSFVKTERHLDPAVQAESVEGSELSPLEPVMVVVEVVEGRPTFRLGGRRIASDRELVGILSRMENKADGAFVSVADDVPFGWAAAALQACRTAGFPVVTYVPMEEQP